MKVLVTGSPGAGKTAIMQHMQRVVNQLGAGKHIVTYDLDSFGYYVREIPTPYAPDSSPYRTHYIVPPIAVKALIENDGRDVWCFGLGKNIWDATPYEDAKGHEKQVSAIGDLEWDRKVVIVWNPSAPGEYARRFSTERTNPYGKDAYTQGRVIDFACRLYNREHPVEFTRLDTTGQDLVTTVAHLTALLYKGARK